MKKLLIEMVREYLAFNAVREFVSSLNLKDKNEWIEYCKNNVVPQN